MSLPPQTCTQVLPASGIDLSLPGDRLMCVALCAALQSRLSKRPHVVSLMQGPTRVYEHTN